MRPSASIASRASRPWRSARTLPIFAEHCQRDESLGLLVPVVVGHEFRLGETLPNARHLPSVGGPLRGRKSRGRPGHQYIRVSADSYRALWTHVMRSWEEVMRGLIGVGARQVCAQAVRPG